MSVTVRTKSYLLKGGFSELLQGKQLMFIIRLGSNTTVVRQVVGTAVPTTAIVCIVAGMNMSLEGK